jgi:hypothetical protein
MDKAAVEKAIDLLAGEVTTSITADEALKFTQAALNLARVLAITGNIEPSNNE